MRWHKETQRGDIRGKMIKKKHLSIITWLTNTHTFWEKLHMTLSSVYLIGPKYILQHIVFTFYGPTHSLSHIINNNNKKDLYSCDNNNNINKGKKQYIGKLVLVLFNSSVTTTITSIIREPNINHQHHHHNLNQG